MRPNLANISDMLKTLALIVFVLLVFEAVLRNVDSSAHAQAAPRRMAVTIDDLATRGYKVTPHPGFRIPRLWRSVSDF